MREIQLTTKGFVAKVDDEDFDRVSKFAWYARKTTTQGLVYATRTITTTPGKETSIQMHRMILGITEPKVRLDHKNGIGTDNQKHNLRICSQAQNSYNRRKQSRPASSRFKGVHWLARNKKWIARIKINGKLIYLGLSPVEEDAARMYDREARLKFGEFARLNFPSENTT